MKIVSSKSKTKKVREFNKKEWKLIHPKHFGVQQDNKYWAKKKFFFKAVDGKEIVGTLNGDFRAGVMYISHLLPFKVISAIKRVYLSCRIVLPIPKENLLAI